MNKLGIEINRDDTPISIAHYTQCDTNGRKHSTLCVEATTKGWAKFTETVTFTYEGITFVSKTMEKWLNEIKAVKWTGKMISVVFGQLPFHPTQS